jgi:hypothetical protein
MNNQREEQRKRKGRLRGREEREGWGRLNCA